MASMAYGSDAIDATRRSSKGRGAGTVARVEVGPEAVLVPDVALEPFQRGGLAAPRVEEVAPRIDGRVAVAQII